MRHFRFLLLWMVAAVLVSCGTKSTVPITGRQRTLMVSDEQVLSLSNQQYSEYMKTAKPSTNKANTEMVKRVGQRLATAVVNYLNATLGMSCYTLDVLDLGTYAKAIREAKGKDMFINQVWDEKYDGKRKEIDWQKEMTRAAIKQQYGAQALNVLMAGAGVSSGLQNIAGTVFGLGAQGASAKYSRDHESEADHLGIIFAAMAGYDPQVAVSFWQRMSQATGGGSTSWLSTHPSDATRIQQIQGWMPEAMQYYQQSTGATLNGKKVTKTLHISTKKKK